MRRPPPQFIAGTPGFAAPPRVPACLLTHLLLVPAPRFRNFYKSRFAFHQEAAGRRRETRSYDGGFSSLRPRELFFIASHSSNLRLTYGTFVVSVAEVMKTPCCVCLPARPAGFCPDTTPPPQREMDHLGQLWCKLQPALVNTVEGVERRQEQR